MIDRDNSLPQLPDGWVWTRIGDVADLLRGVSYAKDESSKEIKGGYVSILRATNINRELNFNDLVYVLSKRVKGEQYVKAFDILIAMSSGSKNLVGKASQAKSDFNGGFGAFCGLVRITPKLDRKFVGFYFQSPNYRNEISQLSSGININNLRRSHIELLSLPLPPLPEQRRIVAKIEELFTKLDAGVGSLKQVKAQLKGYRRAVLKHAFEGKLTKEWREAHKGEMGPPSVLLEHIKEERKKNAKGKVRELPPLNTSDLPELPEGWSYLTLDYLVSNDRNSIRRGPFGSAIKKAFFVPHGYKVYEQGNVIYNDFNRGKYFIDENKFNELISFEVKPGDILMSCSGSVGQIVVVPDGIKPGIINQALLKITLDKKILNTQYFIYLFKSRIDEILWMNTRGSAMVNISSVNDLRRVPFAVPSMAEQVQIVEEIERRLSVADQIEKVAEQSFMQAERLRQSILKRAFEGKLMPQDPNDEPTEKLLERIKAEKTKREAEKKAAGRGRKRLNTIQGSLM